MRVHSHVLEEKSRNIFRKKIISFNWVSRQQFPDYGLDEQVQIFKNDKPTRYYFFVQIKGSATIPESQDSPTYDFKTGHLIQYIDNPLPVMLVLYDSKSDRMLYEWVSTLVKNSSPNFIRKLHFQKTFRVRFNKKLDMMNASIIEKEVRHQYFGIDDRGQRIPEEFIISISINFPDPVKSDIFSRIKQWLRNDSLSNFIKINETKNPDKKIEVNLKPYTLTFFDDEKPNTIDLHKDSENKFSPDDLVSTLKVAIAITISSCGLKNRALDLVRRIVFENYPISKDASLLFSLPSLPLRYAELNRVAEAMEISEQLLRRGYFTCAEIISSSAIFNASNSRFYFQHYRRFLKSSIKYTKAEKAKGSIHYSIANNLRYDSFFKEAIHHYNKAAKLDSSYRQKSYWWAELGGCFFLLNKYIWAENCYKKAIALGEKKIPVIALLADTYLYEGKFKEAKEKFDNYFKIANNPFPEFILKHWLANFLSNLFENVKRNHSLAWQLAEEAYEHKSPQKFFRAIKTDPLCGYAWFNYAIDRSKESPNEMHKEWLATAIIQEWDIEAWSNTIISMVSDVKIPSRKIVLSAIFYAFKLHRDALKEEIEKSITPYYNQEEVKDFISKIYEIYQKSELIFPKKDVITLRIFPPK